jgi:pimeloyl-ACP methyl ester carboxylesterase
MKLVPLILLIILLSFHSLLAQDVKTSKGNANGKTFRYHYIKPSGIKKGIVILLPGSGEKCQSVLSNVSLAKQLVAQGFAVIAPEVHTLLYADEYSINILNELLKAKIKEYGTKSIILGGFSSGGAIVTRYAEYLVSKNFQIDLKALFVIDPPLDLQRVYTAGMNMMQNCDGIIKRDGANIKAQLENAFGGSPTEKIDQYTSNSAFTANSNNGGNAKFLMSIPIRLYSEPDLDFVKRVYCNKLEKSNINATDLEALHEFLLKSGNNRCEYIPTSGRGFHSWNIIEPNNFLEWIIKVSS